MRASRFAATASRPLGWFGIGRPLEIQRYIARDSPESAARVADGLLDSIESLGESPHRGAVPRDERLKQSGFRFLVVPPHVVLYKVIRRQVRVYRVLHGKRAYQDVL